MSFYECFIIYWSETKWAKLKGFKQQWLTHYCNSVGDSSAPYLFLLKLLEQLHSNMSSIENVISKMASCSSKSLLFCATSHYSVNLSELLYRMVAGFQEREFSDGKPQCADRFQTSAFISMLMFHWSEQAMWSTPVNVGEDYISTWILEGMVYRELPV